MYGRKASLSRKQLKHGRELRWFSVDVGARAWRLGVYRGVQFGGWVGVTVIIEEKCIRCKSCEIRFIKQLCMKA